LYGDFIGSHLGSLRANDSTLLVDADTNAFFGTFVGDGSSLSGISLSQLNEVGITSPQYGDLLTYDGTNWTNFGGLSLSGDYYINIVGLDSSLIVDAENNIIYANEVNTNILKHDADSLTVEPLSGNSSDLRLYRTNQLPDGSQSAVGTLFFDTVSSSIRDTIAYIQAYGSDNPLENYPKGFLELSVIDENGNTSENNVMTLTWEGNTGFGTYTPTERLDVRGNGIFTGTVTAASFKGSIVADDSTTIVDAINNKITIDTLEVSNLITTPTVGTPEISSDGAILLTAATRIEVSSSPFKMASFTTAERDVLSAENGDVIYNTTDNKFQGYANSTWVDLH
jgi:hypothetical protein